MDHKKQNESTEAWELKFENWLRKEPISRSSSEYLLDLKRKIHSSELELVIDECLSTLPVEASERFNQQVEQRLRPERKLISFPSFIRIATPIAAAAAIAIALIQDLATDPSLPRERDLSYVSSESTESLDPELQEIFSLASSLNGVSDITRISKGMDAYGQLVD